MVLQCNLPFPCDTFEEAVRLRDAMVSAGILHETRGDTYTLSYQHDQWYVIISTGNIRGMVADLEEENFL